MELIVISKSELRLLIEDVLRTEIQTFQAPNPETELLTRAGAAKVLNVSIPTLDRWKKEGKIPFVRYGAAVRFDKLKLLESAQTVKKWGRS